MKKYLILLFLLFIVIMVGCKKTQPEVYTIALITDVGDIDDRSFNQGAWEGVLEYVEGKNITYKYYRPAEQSDDAYIAAIDLAVSNGAEIVVTPGYLFEAPVNVTQKKYPNVKFVLLDGNPASATNGTLENNTYSIFYAEAEAGYLAGYAAVHDGYRKLGFMGGMAVPAVVRYGYGFVLGADAAATELGLNSNIEVKYHYTGGFSATPAVQATAASMYNAGTEVIFACGGAVGQSVMAAAAASTNGGKVIGVDVDQSGDSPTVITSAMKGLGSSVVNALKAYFDGKWDTIGGKSVVLNAAQNGVGLPHDFSRFQTLDQEAYDTIFAKIVDGTVVVDVDETELDINKAIDVAHTTIVVIS